MYLTLLPCAISSSLTSSCSLAFVVDYFPRLPILSKLIGSTMRSTSLLASEYDSCGHRRCWTAVASCPYYSCRRRALSALFSYSLLCALLRGRRWQSSVFRLLIFVRAKRVSSSYQVPPQKKNLYRLYGNKRLLFVRLILVLVWK